MSPVFTECRLPQIEQYLSTRYARVQLSGQNGVPSAEFVSVDVGVLTVDDARIDFDFGYDFDALDALCLIRVRAGEISRIHGRAEERFGPGEVYSAGPPQERHRGQVRGTALTSYRMSPSLLSCLAADQSGSSESPVRLIAHSVVSADGRLRMCRLLDHLRDQLLTDPVGRDEPLLISTASQYLAAGVLTSFPTTMAAEAARDRRDARSRTAQRACHFIDDNATTPITLADIAAAVAVSPRTLQLAFRHHLDTTPLAYLRGVRLQLAHRTLCAAGPESELTVHGVASRFGFIDHSRFSQLYRSTYGRTPSQSLRSD